MDIDPGASWIKFPAVRGFMRAVFIGLGVPARDAAVCADVLIKADMLGFDSHGISRMKPIYYDRIRQGIQSPKTRFEVVRQTPTTAVVDGHHGMGQVIAHRAMALAIAKARRLGLGMTVVRNSTHFGMAGYYSLMAAEAGMIGITGTNARPSVAPTFGVENMLGTNPLTFAIPTDEKFPFLLDCATSITQRGKVEVYAKLGRKMPPGWVIGRDGSAKTDPKAVLTDLTTGAAALVPLGGIGEELAGYKGYGYCTAVEILSAALQGGAFLQGLTGTRGGKKVPYALGHFFLAINVRAFTRLAAFQKTAGDILRALRASRRMPGARRIYTAGEKEHLVWLARRGRGAPVNRETQREMRTMRDALGLTRYRFPFEG